MKCQIELHHIALRMIICQENESQYEYGSCNAQELLSLAVALG
jgi:hypothetical protein